MVACQPQLVRALTPTFALRAPLAAALFCQTEASGVTLTP